MDVTLIIVLAIAAVVFFGAVFAAVNAFGTRLTGKQIQEDPELRNHVEPELRDEEFPVRADY